MCCNQNNPTLFASTVFSVGTAAALRYFLPSLSVPRVILVLSFLVALGPTTVAMLANVAYHLALQLGAYIFTMTLTLLHYVKFGSIATPSASKAFVNSTDAALNHYYCSWNGRTELEAAQFVKMAKQAYDIACKATGDLLAEIVSKRAERAPRNPSDPVYVRLTAEISILEEKLAYLQAKELGLKDVYGTVTRRRGAARCSLTVFASSRPRRSQPHAASARCSQCAGSRAGTCRCSGAAAGGERGEFRPSASGQGRGALPGLYPS